MVSAVVVIAAISLVVLRALVLQAALFVAVRALRLWSAPAWTRFPDCRTRVTAHYPKFAAIVARRVDPHRPTGLLLTLTVFAAFYLLALFSGLTEHILESRGTIRSDNAIDAALASCRIEPFVSAFLWVRNLGSTPAILAAVIIATGFLWPQRGAQIVIALWLTCLGAVATTTVGRPLVGGHRTEFVPDVYAAGWSFQSGRATAATAVYGFIAYAIARSLPGFRERFEVGYWAGILILLIGFSRIFLGVHYVTDVVGGFLVGASGC
jgi:membrane-associated phospholipid phosphatase